MQHVSTDKLMSDLKKVVDDAEDLVRATAGQAGEKISAARERAEDSVRAAKARMQEMKGDLLKQSREIADNADEYVRENPWRAVGIAAAAGLVVGILLRGR
jgi:ElaB/YqjD/DUF883 family membrane-anchored ribosome-binding protein